MLSQGELGILAGLISLSGFIPYIISVLRKKTRPSRASWFIWSAVALMIVASYYSVGARNTLWLALANAFGISIIAILSLRFGKGGWTVTDKACLGGAGSSIVIWFVSGSAAIALVMNILSDFAGVIPTVKKLIDRAGPEDRLSWGIWLVADTLTLMAAESWDISIIIYPLYLFFHSALIFGLTFRR
jgi:hypothetical protein